MIGDAAGERRAVTPTQAVLAAEADRYRAMVGGDVDALRTMCDPSLRYVMYTGEVATLETWLGYIASGHFRYERIEHPVERVDIRGDVAVVSGTMHAHGKVDGEFVVLSSRTTSVLTRHEATWRLVAYQATRVA